MDVLFALLLAFAAPPPPRDDAAMINRALARARELVATEKGVPKQLADESLCIAIFPWMQYQHIAMDNTGAFRIVNAKGEGLVACRTGATWGGPWSRAYIVEMAAIGEDSKEWGEATDVLLLLRSRAAAERLRAGTMELSGLRLQAGVAKDPAPGKEPDVIAFGQTWKPNYDTESYRSGNQMVRRQYVKSRERIRFSGLTLSTASLVKAGTNTFLYEPLLPASRALSEPLPEDEKPLAVTVEEEWKAYSEKASGGGPVKPEHREMAWKLRDRDNRTRWAIALATVLDRASPSRERKVTFCEPPGPVTTTTTKVRGSLTGFRPVRSVELAGIAATLTAVEGGMDFVVEVPLQQGENVLTGTIEETSGVQESMQTTIVRTAGAKGRRPAKPRR